MTAYDDGYQVALRDAYEAVQKVSAEWTTHGDDWFPVPGPRVKREALHAIESLRNAANG